MGEGEFECVRVFVIVFFSLYNLLCIWFKLGLEGAIETISVSVSAECGGNGDAIEDFVLLDCLH